MSQLSPRNRSCKDRVQRGVVVAVGSLLVACSIQDKDAERYPYTGDCEGEQCGTLPSRPPSSSQPKPEAGTDAMSGPAGDAGIGTLSGDVAIFNDTTFDGATRYVGDGTVAAEPARGGMRVEGTINEGAYSLSGVQAPLWVEVEPSSGTDEILATLMFVESVGMTDLYVTRRTTLEVIADSLLVQQGIESGTGHAVVTFRDAMGDPVPGIVVEAPDAIVAYDTGSGVYQESDDGTGVPGRAILLNVTADPLPGAPFTLQYSGAESGTVSLRMARDTLSLVDVAF